MAFGKIGLDRETFWVMTPREFFNAWEGHSEMETERLESQHKSMRAVIFSAMRYHAASTAWTKKQSRSISNQKFPWEEGGKKASNGGEPLSYDKIMPILEKTLT